MPETLSLTTQFKVITCYRTDCAVQFAIPAWYEQKLRETQDTFFCPHGHPQGFCGKNEEQKLRDELAAKARQMEYLEADLARARRDRDHHERSAQITRGKAKALRKRVAAGLCPCCRRPFANLMRHMQHEHPNFAAKED